MTPTDVPDLIAAIIAAHNNGGITRQQALDSYDVADIVAFSSMLKEADESAYSGLVAARGQHRPPTDLEAEERRLKAQATPENNAAFDELVAEASSWPDPSPLIERPDLPTWPVDILPDWMANHIRSSADQLQVPIDLCAQFAMGALAAAAMGHGRVVLGGRWAPGLTRRM